METRTDSPELGGLLREYRVGLRLRIMVWFVIAVSAIGGLYFYLELSESSKRVEAAAVCGMFAVVAFAYFLCKRRYRVKIYTEGVCLLRGKKSWEIRFDDVHTVWQVSFSHSADLVGIPVCPGPTYSSIVLEGDGLKITLDNHLENFKEIAASIHDNTFPRIWQTCCQKHEAGEWLGFGPFSLNKEGLCYRHKTLPLKNIASFAIRGGCVYVRAKGSLFEWSEPIRKIPNSLVFLKLMDSALGTTSKLSPEAG